MTTAKHGWSGTDTAALMFATSATTAQSDHRRDVGALTRQLMESHHAPFVPIIADSRSQEAVVYLIKKSGAIRHLGK
jgi:hypothetical protein